MSFESFHFLRPMWLLALSLLLPAAWLGLHAARSSSAWRRVCDANLLQHLMLDGGRAGARFTLPVFVVGWTAACVALAGPTWERLPVPAYSEPVQTVIALNLAPSMQTADVAPSRLVRARYKLLDVLEQVEGAVGLVIFAEEPYPVTPLTDDARVIAQQVPLLEPSLMPGRRAHLGRAIDEAVRLLSAAGAQQGRVLILSDGVGDAPRSAVAAAERAAAAGYSVSALGFGDDAGELRAVTDAGAGRFEAMRTDDADLTRLLASASDAPLLGLAPTESGVQADAWRDVGVWLVWIPLLLAPLAFRRGWAAAPCALLLFGLSATQPQTARADASDWLWRADQRAAEAFEQGEHEAAAELFEDPDWRASAQYRAGDYESAAQVWQARDDVESQYNLGNALARAGALEDALGAYDRALELQADHEDAQFNRDLVAKLLEEQQQQEQEQQEQEQQSQDSASDSQEQDPQGESGEPSEDASPGGESQASEPEDAESESAASENAEPDASESAGSETTASESSGAEPEQADASESQGSQQSQEPTSQSQAAQSEGESSEGEDAQAQASAAAGDAAPQGEEEERQADAPTAGRPSPEAADAEMPRGHASAPSEYSESDQEVEQWLNRVPDDPGALLREKLRRRHAEQRYGRSSSQGEWR